MFIRSRSRKKMMRFRNTDSNLAMYSLLSQEEGEILVEFWIQALGYYLGRELQKNVL
jgi:hypothetical protein